MDFYYLAGSAPCRAVQMTAKAVGVDLNLKVLNLMAGEHLKPEFIKINPQHTIPTLVDNGLALWESRAIMVYLAEKYGKDDTLYPKDPAKRAVISQRLYFVCTNVLVTITTHKFSPKPQPMKRNFRKWRRLLRSSTPSWKVKPMPLAAI